jgi:hypothetical protein
MIENGKKSDDDQLVVEVIHSQLEHFRKIEPPCRGIELPDGIVLRHTLSQSLYFYLRTGVENGKIKTQIFASDSPYDMRKSCIGAVVTGMFETQADRIHLEKLENLIREWVVFVGDVPVVERDFQSFKINQ